MEILDITIKLFTGLILLFLLVQVSGKKLMNQITPFHYVSAIVLGELIGNATYRSSVPFYHVFFAIILWGLILYIIDFFSLKLFRFRSKVEGEPTTVIANGKVDFSGLRSCRMNLNQLQSLLRQSETFSIREVAFAFIEPNGALSIMKKTQYQKPVKRDFPMPVKEAELPIAVVRDGQYLKKNLQQIGKNMEWLDTELRKQGIQTIKEVLFADWAENSLFVVKHEAGTGS